MPTVEHASDTVQVLFEQYARTNGLEIDTMPAAVAMTVNALHQGTVPYLALLSDLPASARAFDWMECALRAYADWCNCTVVLDTPPG